MVVARWGNECRDEQTELIAGKAGTLNGLLARCITEEVLIQRNLSSKRVSFFFWSTGSLFFLSFGGSVGMCIV